MMNDSLNFWIRGNSCVPEADSKYIEMLCDYYGDYFLTTDPYDREKDFYSISFDCGRYREDIGGAQTFAAGMIATLAAFLLIN